MKRPISVTLDTKQVEKIDGDRLVKDIGRSGIVRIALSEYYDRRREYEDIETHETKRER